MEWQNKGKELETFYAQWENAQNIAFFGFGQWGEFLISQLAKDVTIAVILDSDESKTGKTFLGIDILHPTGIDLKEYKIVVTTHYHEISKYLKSHGLQEGIHFCDINTFVAVWKWYTNSQVHFCEIHTAITTKCTLCCKNCNMFIPYYNSNTSHHEPKEKLFENFADFFKSIDKVYNLVLLGGEPFLHPEISDIIETIYTKYSKQIGMISIVTNGTIIPNEAVLTTIKNFNVHINISDYSDTIKYEDKIRELKTNLEKFGINYSANKSDAWLDFNFPHNPLCIPNEHITKHMHLCNPIFKGLNDGKLYYCHIVWSAVKAGLLEDNTNDYIEISSLDPYNKLDLIFLIEYYLGFMTTGYVTLCKQCGGCGVDNKSFIPSAIQNRID